MLLGANIMNNGKDNLEKFDSKFDGVIFLGYSTTSKAFWVFNKRTLIVGESILVVFEEFNDLPLKDISRSAGIEENMKSFEITKDDKETQEEANEKDIQLEVVLPQLQDQKHDGENSSLSKEWRFVHNHSTNLIIGDPSRGVTTRDSIKNICKNLTFL